jgi:drug/metabolite transporter (DMT)-like permease
MDCTVDRQQTVVRDRKTSAMTKRGALLFISLGLAWGIPYLLIKVAVGELSPVVLVFARTSLAAVLLVPVAFAKGAVGPVLAHWRMLIVYSVAEIVVPWLLLTRAEQRLSSSLAGLLIAAVPLASVGVAFVSGRRAHLGRIGALGLLVGFAGVAFLVGVDVHGSALSAVGEMVFVVLGYATGATLLGRSLGTAPGLGVVAASFVISSVIYAPFAIPNLPHHLPSAKVIWSVALLVVVCTMIAFLLLFALVAEVGSVRATTITYVNPAVAVIAGALILHERVTVWTVVGFALVLSGCLLVSRSRRTPVAQPDPRPLADLSSDGIALAEAS